MLLLDNDVLRKYRDANPDPTVVSYLATHSSDPWAISAIVLYESLSYYDAQSRRQRQQYELTQLLNEILAFDGNTALEAATLEASLDAAGTALDAADLLIAATARQHGATLVTANKNDFDKQPIHELLDVDVIDTAQEHDGP